MMNVVIACIPCYLQHPPQWFHVLLIITPLKIAYFGYDINNILQHSHKIHRIAHTWEWGSWCFVSSNFELHSAFAPMINSLPPGKFEWNFRHVICKQIIVIDGWGISCEIALIWMSLDFTDDQSILVQVMAWCCQATSHYQSQCWPRSVVPYGVTRPQWVNNNICDVSFYHTKLWCNFSQSSFTRKLTILHAKARLYINHFHDIIIKHFKGISKTRFPNQAQFPA